MLHNTSDHLGSPPRAKARLTKDKRKLQQATHWVSYRQRSPWLTWQACTPTTTRGATRSPGNNHPSPPVPLRHPKLGHRYWGIGGHVSQNSNHTPRHPEARGVSRHQGIMAQITQVYRYWGIEHKWRVSRHQDTKVIEGYEEVKERHIYREEGNMPSVFLAPTLIALYSNSDSKLTLRMSHSEVTTSAWYAR